MGMADPAEILQQGRGWLQEGEAPEAVVEEAAQLLGGAGSDTVRAAWLLVIAEAQLKACCAAEAIEAASESFALFKTSGASKACAAAAASALADANILKQDFDDAITAASAAANLYARLGDAEGEAAMHLKFASAYLMQMKDPYTAARAALSAAQMFQEQGDKRSLAEALQTAAQAQMLYDPEQALKAAKDALSACGDPRAASLKGEVSRTVAAVKTQIALEQNADMAGAMSSRGDQHITHKWPKVPQQQGEMPADPFAVKAYIAASQGAITNTLTRHEQAMGETKEKRGTMFMRKAFKWTEGRHATDEAWFRQELRYLPPPGAKAAEE